MHTVEVLTYVWMKRLFLCILLYACLNMPVQSIPYSRSRQTRRDQRLRRNPDSSTFYSCGGRRSFVTQIHIPPPPPPFPSFPETCAHRTKNPSCAHRSKILNKYYELL